MHFFKMTYVQVCVMSKKKTVVKMTSVDMPLFSIQFYNARHIFKIEDLSKWTNLQITFILKE